jgi:thiamine-monophosphate kinase
MLGEFELIRKITKSLKLPSSVLIGPGDDCAVVRLCNKKRARQASSLHLLTTDMLIEGKHFRRDWMTSREIGEKAMRVNLSDIAAMGGKPLFALVSVGLPKSFRVSEAKELFLGLRKAAEKSRTAIVGGDTNRADRLTVNVAIVGEAGRFLTRSGAKVGDAIYVTGTLGDSVLGLAALRKKKKKGYEFFIRKHFCPPDRLSVGLKLAANRQVHSLIDLSDGLAGDLEHLLKASRVGADIWRDKIPSSPGFIRKAEGLGLDPEKLQLTGGEDYELLFTASAHVKIPPKINGASVTRIGSILPGKSGNSLKGLTGFRHF